MPINLICGICARTGGIGFKGKLPWNHIKEDLLLFRDLTTGKKIYHPVLKTLIAKEDNNNLSILNEFNTILREEYKYDNAVVMGANTYLSLPNHFLKKRDNHVITSSRYESFTEELIEKGETSDRFLHTFLHNDLDNKLLASMNKQYNNVWIIGGEKIYKMMMNNYLTQIDRVYLSNIYTKKEFSFDSYFYSLEDFLKKIAYTHKLVYISEIPIIKERDDIEQYFDFAIYERNKLPKIPKSHR